MRLLSRVIKAGEIRSGPPVSTGGSPPCGEPGIDVPQDAPSVPWQNADEYTRQTMEKAFHRAKQITDSAEGYSARQTEQARNTIAKESAAEKKRGYSEGYAEGSARGKEAGYEAGYRAGQSEGIKKAESDNQKSLQELGRMIEEVEQSKTRILQEFQDDLQNLAIAIAKAILKKDLEIDDGAMRSIILNAMDAYRNQGWVRIYVSKDTADILLKADNSIVDDLKGISDNVKVIPSSGLDDGGCVLEMPDQVIDAGVSSQLKKIKSEITTAMESENS